MSSLGILSDVRSLNVSDLVLSPDSVKSASNFPSLAPVTQDLPPLGEDDRNDDEYQSDVSVITMEEHHENQNDTLGITNLSCQCVLVTPKGIQSLLASASLWSVRNLNFWADRMGKEATSLFAKTLQSNALPSLRTLQLGGKTFKSSDGALVRSLLDLQDLQKLVISGSWLMDQELSIAGKLIQDSDTLVSFALVDTSSLTLNGMKTFSKYLSLTKSVKNFRFEGFTDECIVKTLCDALSPILLRSLQLSHCRVGKPVCESIANIIRQSDVLYSLNIAQNQLSDKDCEVLALSMESSCVPRALRGAPPGRNGTRMLEAARKNERVYKSWKRTAFLLSMSKQIAPKSPLRILRNSKMLERHCIDEIFKFTGIEIDKTSRPQKTPFNDAARYPLVQHKSI